MALTRINSSKPGLDRIHIIALAFFLSFFIHILVFAAIQNLLPRSFFKSNMRVYQVNLAKPSAEELDEDEGGGDHEKDQIERDPDLNANEATISLDTGIEAYAPYARVIKERIFYHWAYPLSAQNEGMQGDLQVVFRIDNFGSLIQCEIGKTSGYQILDDCAVDAIKLASPFPPFPDSLDIQFLNINASFSYQLSLE